MRITSTITVTIIITYHAITTTCYYYYILFLLHTFTSTDLAQHLRPFLLLEDEAGHTRFDRVSMQLLTRIVKCPNHDTRS